MFLLLVGAFVFLWFTVKLPADLPPVQSSIVYDVKGRQIASFNQNGLREAVKLDQVSPAVVDALISAEDRDFFEHGGVDPAGIVRALWNDVRGQPLEGASTITQQLVKNSYLSPDRSPVRKAKEAVLAVKLERHTDKRDILERYLNIVYFGRGTYGIQAAAHVYFSTTAAQLNVNQAALLVGLLKSPETADPTTAPQTATERRNAVIDAMADAGKLSAADAAAAKQQPLGATDRAASQSVVNSTAAPWFVELVRQQAVAQFGEERVYGGGLQITTTLDLDDQMAAEAAIAQVLNEPDDPQAALVALDKSGGIRAYVGGRDYNALKVDEARGKDGGGSGRQAGSTFKPFTLAASIENGQPVRKIYDGPPQITLPVDGGGWTVSNYGDEGFGPIDVIDGTVHSVNTVYAQLILDTGPDKAVAMAHAAGITSDLPVEPSIALGTGETSPYEMADAYLTFAKDGERVEPYAITKVVASDGNTIFEPRPVTTRAMKEETAQVVNHVLQQVVDRGTGTAAKLDRPVAGKTGTTENNGDAWFAGYTPNYAAAVWMGYPEGSSRPMDDVHGISVTGGTLPAKIWQQFMTGAVADAPVENFTAPPDELLAPPPPPPGPTPPVTLPPVTPPPPSTSVTTSTTGPDRSTTSTSTSTTSTTTTTTAPSRP